MVGVVVTEPGNLSEQGRWIPGWQEPGGGTRCRKQGGHGGRDDHLEQDSCSGGQNSQTAPTRGLSCLTLVLVRKPAGFSLHLDKEEVIGQVKKHLPASQSQRVTATK